MCSYSQLQRESNLGALFAQGGHEEAATLFARSAAAAEAAVERVKGGGGGAGAIPSSTCTSPVTLRELHASALGGVGRTAIARKDWESAEDALSKVQAS